MKILSFSYCFPNHAAPNFGVFVRQRLAAMAASEELQVASPVPSFPVVSRFRGDCGPLREEWQGLTVHRPRFFCVPGIFKSFDGPLYARGLRRWLEGLVPEFRPDVLDAHFIWPDGVGVSLLAKEFELPYVITLRGWLYEAMGRPRILKQCVKAMQDASAIIAVSEHLARTAIELGASAERMHVIPNGVDLARFQPRDKIAARKALGLPVDARLIVSVAHLGPRKGHHEAVGALASLPDDVRLVLVGGDPQRGQSERDLRKLIEARGLNGRVIFAGRQPYDKVPIYFNAADVSLLASYREGCPNVVLESLASGVPVVASNVGNVSDMLEDGRNGRIVPPQTVEPLAEALGDMLGRMLPPEEICKSPAVRSWDDVAADACSVLRCAAGRSGVSRERVESCR